MAVGKIRSASHAPHFADRAGMPPEAFRGGAWDDDSGLKTDSKREQRVVAPGPGSKGKRTVANNSKSGFNLRGVIEVLTEHGLDPVAEISKTLMELVPVRDRDGRPVMDDKGKPVMTNALPIDVRTKTLAALIEYVHPKLKSVEMTVKKTELTDDQINERLAALLERQQATPTVKKV